MNNCDPTQQQAVQDRLEALYEADGRHDPAHPMHGLYTGLAQAAQQQEVLTDPTPLSPAAQAVLDAAHEAWITKDDSRSIAAAALRAAADRARRGPEHWEGSYPDDYDNGWNEAVDYLTTIATELENHQ